MYMFVLMLMIQIMAGLILGKARINPLLLLKLAFLLQKPCHAFKSF